jgi:1,4-alpha-glucan branching enzyme
MKYLSIIVLVIVAMRSYVVAQTPGDSVRLTFRAHQPSSPVMYVPGQFNGWGPNASGVISSGAPSAMTRDGTLGIWVKTYTFKIHEPGSSTRSLGDSVYQYKFNRGGIANGWYPDPLNPEQNASDNNNSVVRLTKRFWFEMLVTDSADFITRLTAGLVHTNADTIASVTMFTGETQFSSLTTTNVSSGYREDLRIFDRILPTPVPRAWYLRLVARTRGGDSLVYSRGGIAVPRLPLPAYARHGVTLPSTASNDSVTFRLRVPLKDAVYLHVAPVGQNPAAAPAILMRLSPGSDNWWMNLKLAAGTDYEYLYELENGKVITDPWGRQVGDYGTRFSTGPTGLSADNYAWSATGFVRSPLNRLVVYEMHIGEFAGGKLSLSSSQGAFTNMAKLMGYFDTLGVNALEIMPVNDYGSVGRSSNFSWGYDLNTSFALEPLYGTPAGFKALIDSAHAHGIAIILDVVFNHLNDTGPLWQMLPDEVANPYFKSISDVRPNEDQLQFYRDMDHWTDETQEFVYTALKMWLDDYHVDGFRYDYTQGIGWDIAQPTKGILGWTNRIDKEYGGAVYQILEHLPESPALIYYSGATSGWHDSFHDRIFDEARYRNVLLPDMQSLVLGLGAFPGNDTPSEPSSYADRTGPVNATVTHDEQSLIYEMTQNQGVSATEAVLRDKLYSALMFTSLGVPMLWEGMEFAEPRGWAVDALKLTYRPVQFARLGTNEGQSHFAWMRALVRQRIKNPALYRGVFRPLYQYTSQKVLVWGFEDTASTAKVMVVANFRGVQHTIVSVPWLGTGVWYNLADGKRLTVASTTIDTMIVPAYTALVYSTIADTLLTGVQDAPGDAVPTSCSLEQNYPNPFNPKTLIGYQLPALPAGRQGAGWVTLKVYDVLGREVATLVDEVQSPGTYSVSFDGSRLASGVYLYRFHAGSYAETKKLILMK